MSRASKNAKYCTVQCRAQAKAKRHWAKEKEKGIARRAAENPEPGSGKTRMGVMFREFQAKPELVKMLDEGTVPLSYFAHLYNVSEAEVSRAYAAVLIQRELDLAAGEFTQSWSTRAMLPTWKLIRLKELGPGGEGSPEFEGLADELVEAYSVFSRFFFRLEGERPLIETFHLRWIRSIIVAYAVGGKQLILSPPRHGKSELLIRFVIWFIVMFPNIRIMWVAANSDVAKIMLGAVKDHLENNEELIAATLPRGGTYRPPRSSGKPWSGKEIKVNQQSHVGQKSSSMLALGRTSKILSRDVDILIVDDLEDFDTTRELSQRKYSKNKYAEIGTRKEEKTAWVNICSRQHPDDVPAALLKTVGTDQAWRVLVDTAHEDCQLDPEDIEGHDQNGCVLFPQIRSYRWLVEKKQEMDALGIPGAYEMRYLNKPAPTEGIVFHVDRIRDKALDRSRGLGVEELSGGKMIAGLDPASRGTQAAFAWHYVPGALTMIDLETQKAGGFAGALAIMEDWAIRYELRDWYYEDNSQQAEFFSDPRVTKLKRDYGLTIKPHTTGKNKQDPELGISSMAPWYHDGTIILPYGTTEARTKVNLLLGQLELWTTDGIQTGKHRKTDVKMASWFPFPRIIRWNRVETHQQGVARGSEQSYPGISRMNQVAWQTKYPKGR